MRFYLLVLLAFQLIVCRDPTYEFVRCSNDDIAAGCYGLNAQCLNNTSYLNFYGRIVEKETQKRSLTEETQGYSANVKFTDGTKEIEMLCTAYYGDESVKDYDYLACATEETGSCDLIEKVYEVIEEPGNTIKIDAFKGIKLPCGSTSSSSYIKFGLMILMSLFLF